MTATPTLPSPPLVPWFSMPVFVQRWEWAILSLTDDPSCLHSRLLRTWLPTWSGCQQLPLTATDVPWQSENTSSSSVSTLSTPPPSPWGLLSLWITEVSALAAGERAHYYLWVSSAALSLSSACAIIVIMGFCAYLVEKKTQGRLY